MSPVYNTESAREAPAGLAFKAYEIEEIVDISFFRRLGLLVAHAARAAKLSPNQVTVAAGVIGAAGGALLYDPAYAFTGFLGLVAYGIVDSADGQLARLTGRTSELGRVLDGVAGYATHIAIFIAIVAGALHRGGSGWTLVLAVPAAICTVAQAQMYDYHRMLYARVVVQGKRPQEVDPVSIGGALGRLWAVYLAMQRALVGLHMDVERVLAARSVNGAVLERDRATYRSTFYWIVRGWNLLGDNGRRFAIGVLALMGRTEWFFLVVLVPFNIVLLVQAVRTRAADDRFLLELGSATARAS
jgi:phosphatidylglycerophosphate synthase